MNRRTERTIEKIYREVFKKVFNKNRIIQASKGQSQTIISSILQFQNSVQYNEIVEKMK